MAGRWGLRYAVGQPLFALGPQPIPIFGASDFAHLRCSDLDADLQQRVHDVRLVWTPEELGEQALVRGCLD